MSLLSCMTSIGNLATESLISLMDAPEEVALSSGVCILAALFFAQKLSESRQIIRITHLTLVAHELHS